MTRGGIIVVARDADVREAFRRGIVSRGWRDVEVHDSATDAVGAVRSGGCGLAVVHADVGDMEGARAVSVLKAADPQLRIVFATPMSSAELEQRIRDTGIHYYYLYDEADSDELAAAVASAVGAPRRPAAIGPTILLVDDDREYHEVLRLSMEARGYRFLGAETVEEGLRVARRERPDVVLVDIVLNGEVGGVQLSREIRRDPVLKHTPILALSAIGGGAAQRFSPRDDEALFPVDGFFEKPVDPNTLLRRLESLLGGTGER